MENMAVALNRIVKTEIYSKLIQNYIKSNTSQWITDQMTNKYK